MAAQSAHDTKKEADLKNAKAEAKLAKTTGVRSFYVTPELTTTANGGIELTLLCFTLPERKLLGEVSVKASGAPMPHLLRAIAPPRDQGRIADVRVGLAQLRAASRRPISPSVVTISRRAASQLMVRTS